MGFELEDVVPWGRSFSEYVSMFALSEPDLRKHIAGCGDGPAAFNAELTRRGGHVVSVDPLYEFNSEQIRARIDMTFQKVIEQTEINKDNFIWQDITSVEELGKIRLTAMESFLSDYETGKTTGRYVTGKLPELPFDDRIFDLAVCSHFLFLYSDHLTAEFHMRAIREMLRVATEIRVFPLLTLDCKQSPHLDSVIAKMNLSGYSTEISRVKYEFQKGGNEMLIIRNRNA